MALTQAPNMPFRFLDLPLEIQRMILAKYYEESWWIQKRNDPLPTRHPSTSGFRTSLSCNPLLVSRHFQHEARLAIKESKSAHFDDNHVKIPQEPAWFDAAITSIGSDLQKNSISAFKARFPNLDTVVFPTSYPLYSFNEADEAFRGKDLKLILRGEHDKDIAEWVRQKVVSVGRLKDLGELTLETWIESETLEHVWGYDVGSTDDVRHCLQVLLKYGVTVPAFCTKDRELPGDVGISSVEIPRVEIVWDRDAMVWIAQRQDAMNSDTLRRRQDQA
ncbi:hypothetical protein PMZ80_003743 [Knufia obscura]|uniref:Uncharacterized protein n=2 Tax=Knufia TaxID=430999 RepID=A0AAN8ET66_9EURO|nr:hypothetical protein PMZ80_003743 [Knufia obscura]KAK5958343.1 hypothetical protein OHC33_000185 [Knufia fluminis]